MTVRKLTIYRLIIIFVVALIAIMLVAVSFWNQGREKIDYTIWPLIFLGLALAATAYLFIYSRKIADPKIIQKYIDDAVTHERSKILTQLESKEEEVINIEEDLHEVVSKILPKGKFKSTEAYANKLMVNLIKEIQGVLGIVYLAKRKHFSFLTGFALPEDATPPDFKPGENLNGQVAESKEVMVLDEIPEFYFEIHSGLGKGKPNTLVIAPFLHKNTTVAIIEIATFNKDDAERTTKIMEMLGKTAGEKLTQLQKS